jgi:hopanoid biosynthesis associated radical SAM protein HpnH
MSMPVPARQSLRIGAYIIRQRLARRQRFPLIVELEPLYQCNLACAGCGKIQQPDELLRRRMPVEDAIAAMEESGAPMVSIAGGEPLIHPDIDKLAAELIKRRKYVFLCTNALLMEKKMDLFKPSQYFAWAVHIDGLRERHDESVCRDGVFDKAVAAIAEASASRPTRPSSRTTRPTPCGACSTSSTTSSRSTR